MVQDSAYCAADRAAGRMAAASMGDRVPLSLILLRCEIKADGGGRLNFVCRSRIIRQEASSQIQLDV